MCLCTVGMCELSQLMYWLAGGDGVVCRVGLCLCPRKGHELDQAAVPIHV